MLKNGLSVIPTDEGSFRMLMLSCFQSMVLQLGTIIILSNHLSKHFILQKKEELGFNKVRLNICIPDFIIRDPKEYQHLFYQIRNLEFRSMFNYRIYADPESNDGILQLYDVPNTMIALFKTVDSIFSITDADTDDSICAKQRALESFSGILSGLIAQNAYVSLNSDKKG